MRRTLLFLFIIVSLFVVTGLSTRESPAHVLAASGNSARVIYLSPSGEDRANSVAFSPDGNYLAAGTAEGIYIYETATWQEIHFVPTASWVRSLAFSPDGKTLVTGSYDGIVRLWRMPAASLLQEWRGHTGGIHSVSFSGDGAYVSSASDDNTVRIWRVLDGKTIQIFKQGTEGVRTAALSPDGKNVATAGFDNIIRIWRISDGGLLHELKGHTDWIRTLAYSPDGKLLASGGFDKTIRLWDVEDGDLLQTMQGHESSLTSVAFSPNGEYLASSDVDTTVRLWQVADGKLLDIMTGHADFVYSVAFSPDGNEIASGGVDNSIRIWDIRDPNKFDLTPSLSDVPQNCVSCHHPQANGQPARVIEVGCSTCHSNGSLVRDFCPAFPRSGGSSVVNILPINNTSKLGLSSPSQDLAVNIGIYGNGEHLYSRGDVIALVPISGHVAYPGGDVTSVDIQLEIKAGSKPSEILHTKPNAEGAYLFNLTLSPQGDEPPELASPDGWRRSECLMCHDKSLKLGPALPVGDIILTVTAIAPGGEKATDSRWIVNDESQMATIPVKVTLGADQPVPNLPIQASTTLYQWLGRTSLGTTDSAGQAILQVEALSENQTSYQVSVLPTVVNGVLYESKNSTQVSLPPGATNAATVRLEVQAVNGEINGKVSGLNGPIQVWAVIVPDGSADQYTTTADGKFSFSDLPVGQVLVTGDPHALAGQGLTLMPKAIDLSQTTSAQVDLSLKPLDGAALNGKITDEAGNPLPFAWVSAGEQSGQSDPLSGTYALYGLSSGKSIATFSAPGYYSQADPLISQQAGTSSLDAKLVSRPDTQFIPWGDGAVVLPAETVASVEGSSIQVEQGWLWGTGSSEQVLDIQWGDLQIEIPAGQFALERLPAQNGWLYVQAGTGTIQNTDTGKLIPIQAGEMAFLSQQQDAHPVPYNPVVVGALRASGEAPIQPAWQPSLNAQVRDRLAKIGIGTAQIVTFITYFIEVLALLILVLFAVHWMLKKKRKDIKRDKHYFD